MKFNIVILWMYVFFLSDARCDINRLESKTDQEIDEFSGSYVGERGALSQHEALADYLKDIEACKNLPVEESIPQLGWMIRKLAMYNIFQVPERVRVFDMARDCLLSIPNHAQYFVDELERERAALKPGDLRNDYNSHRWQYVAETLIHLPSPQTIRVLGDYLSDERDVPVYSTPVSDDWVPSPPQLASKAIMEIGLRNPPVRMVDYWKAEHPEENALALTKSWYDEVKTGRRGFSFVGQTVEYRFKEDGTVESTALPASILEQDAIWTARPKLPARYPGRRANSRHTSGEINSWIWIGGGLLVGVAGICWFRWKRTSRTV